MSPDDISGGEVFFSSKVTHYLTRVLRLKIGDQVEVLDGSRQLTVSIDSIHGGSVKGKVLQSDAAPERREPHVTLAFGCVRPGPFQEILRHGTEIGVSIFVPVISERVTRRPEHRKDRWQSVIASASAQSRRPLLPKIKPPISLRDFLGTLDEPCLRLLLFSGQGASPILDALAERPGWESAVILTGPEGGFTSAEHNEANQAGFVPVTLGRSVLRTETASILAVGAVCLWYDRLTCPNGME